MENRKIIVAVTAIAALLLLFAGVGYAVFSGNARTYNEGNSDNLAYMTATPSDFNPFANDVSTIFDTYVYDGAVYTTKDIADAAAFAAAGTLYVKNGNVYEEVVGDYDAEATYYAKVNIQDANKAYAFKDQASVVAVEGYSCIQLGTKTVTIDNQTGEAITALDVNIKAADLGTSDFVYIFKFQNAENTAKYAMFYGTGAEARDVKELAVTSIADGATGDVNVTLYIGYVSNVFVPENYIGAATPTAADPVKDHPYIVCDSEPASMANVDFGFNFTIPQPTP